MESVARPDDDDDRDTKRDGVSDEEGLQCESEFLRIKVSLGVNDCEPDSDNSCDQDDRDYSSELKFALTEMRPMYDERTVRLAHTEYEKQLDKLELGLEPDDIMSRGLLPDLAQAAHAGDTRTAAPTLAEMRSIDALEVNRWVREHFIPGRFEINVAGDMALENLLKQLDEVFGVLPNITFSPTVEEDNITQGLLRQVGSDPYHPDDLGAFQRTFTSEKLRRGCTLLSPVGGRGSVVHVFKAGDYRSGGTSPSVRRIADRCVNRLMFLKVRRDSGFGYFVDVTPKHSVIFKDYGFYEIGWLAGQYSRSATGYEYRTNENVIASSAAVRAAMSTEVDDVMFLEVVNTYVQKLNASYSDPGYWVTAMQGLSIRPPVTWPEYVNPNTTNITDVNQTRPGLNRIENMDELKSLAKLSRDDVNAYLKANSWAPQSYLWASVITREGTDTTNYPDPPCQTPNRIV